MSQGAGVKKDPVGYSSVEKTSGNFQPGNFYMGVLVYTTIDKNIIDSEHCGPVVVWLRDCIINRRVAGSIPEITEFLTDNSEQANNALVSPFTRQCELVPGSKRVGGETLCAVH